MKVYIAASYKCIADVDAFAQDLVKADRSIEIVSQWHSQGEEQLEIEKMGHQHFIEKDVEDVRRADLLVFMNCHPFATGNSAGRWVEYGIALERHLPIIAYGDEQESLFLHDDLTLRVRSFDGDALLIAILGAATYHAAKEVQQ